MPTQISVILYSSLSPSDPSIVSGIQERKAGTNGDPLTHSGQNEIATILQKTFPNESSLMDIVVFWLLLYCNIFPRVQWTLWEHWFRLWFDANQGAMADDGDPRSQGICTSGPKALNLVDGESPHSTHVCTCMKSYWYGKCTIAMWPPCPFRWNDIDKVNAQLQNVVITSVQILVIRPEFEITGLRHENWTKQLYQNHLIYTTNTKFVVFIPMIYMNHTIKWYLGFHKDVVPSDTYEVPAITIIICYLH